MNPYLSIVVPAYNEAAHLSSVIAEMARTLDDSGIEYEICIVDNGSSDGTASVISELEKKYSRITHVRLEKNQQYGGGVRAGLAAAKGEMLGWIHADGQADPRDIIRLYRAMREGRRELGKAVRITSSESSIRKVMSFVYFRIFQILFRGPYRDPNGTPKLLTRGALRKLSLESQDWFLDPEFVIKGLRYRMPIAEVETTWRSRKSGGTKAHLFIAGMKFLKDMIVYRVGLK